MKGKEIHNKPRIQINPLYIGRILKHLFFSMLTFIALAGQCQSAAEWSAYKQKCGLPANLLYNTWVAQGCHCPANEQQSSKYSSGNQNSSNTQQQANDAKKQLSDEASALNEKGSSAYNNGDYETAVKYFQDALDKTPDDKNIAENLQTAKDQLAAQKQRTFDNSKQQTISQLKGVTQIDGNDSNNSGLKGLSNNPSNIGLKEVNQVKSFDLPRIIKINDIPDSLPSEQKQKLNKEKEHLERRLDSLQGAIAAFNITCKSVTTNNTLLLNECESNYMKLNAKEGKLTQDILAFKKTLIEQVEKQITKDSNKVQIVLKEINLLRFNKTTEDCEKWEDESNDEKKKMTNVTIEIFVEEFITKLQTNADELSSVHLEKAKIVDTYMESKVTNPQDLDGAKLQKALELIGHAVDNEEKVKEVKEWLDVFGKIFENVLESPEDKPSKFEVVKKTVELLEVVFNCRPETKMMITGTISAYQIIESYGDLYYGRVDVNNLTELNEQELKNLKSWDKILERHMINLKFAKKELSVLEEN